MAKAKEGVYPLTFTTDARLHSLARGSGSVDLHPKTTSKNVLFDCAACCKNQFQDAGEYRETEQPK